MKAIYTYKSHQEFIEAMLAQESFGRGARTAMAEFLGVQKSFVSLVLSKKVDFTLEQTLKIAKFLRLDADDQKFLLLMAGRDRAGSIDLRNFYEDELKKIRDEREKIHTQIQSESSLSEAEYSLYTSAWYHPVIHMCLRNPALKTAEKISKVLKISPEEVSASFKLLEKIGFAERIKGVWHSKVVRFNAEKESPGLRALHSTWRHMATHSLHSPDPKDLHYTVVASADAKALETLRQMILELVKNFEPVIQKADDKEVVAFTIDLFRVGSDR